MDVIKLKTKLIYVVYEYDKDHDLNSMASFEDVSDAKDYIDVLVSECGIDIHRVILVSVPFCYS